MRLRFRIGETEHAVEAAWVDGGIQVTLPGRTVTVALHRLDEHAFLLRAGARRISCVAGGVGQQRQLWVDGRTIAYELADTRRAVTAGGGDAELVASLPGVVRQVFVTAGDRVAAGDKLLVLESMKMETIVHAPHAGLVESVFCAEGQNVQGGEHLVAIREDDA